MKLTNKGFWIASAILVLLNLFVYLWWANRPFVTVRPAQLNRELLAGLEAEARRLQAMLDAACTSEDLLAYRRGEIGPLVRPNTLLSVTPSPDARAPSAPSARPSVPNGSLAAPAAPSEAAPPSAASAAPATVSVPQASSTMMQPEQLVALLEAATVRVLVFSEQMKYLGHGTGFFIDKSTVVTNRHVIEAGKRFAITSSFLGSKPLPVKLVAVTRDSEYMNPDFAVLRAETRLDNVRPLAIATVPQPLQTVVAAGFPSSDIRVDANAVTPNTVFSQGEVSVLQRQTNGMELILHTAKIATGSSGGPLVNRCGNVVGVNTFIGAQADRFSDRSLYALSGAALQSFLNQSGQPYTKISSDCSAKSPS
jgi:S1-C subfamily serine protease